MKKSAKGTTKVISVKSLSHKDIQEMWVLFESYYTDVSFTMFLKDLNEKTDIIITRSQETGEIVGFSTLLVYRAQIKSKECKVVFSGDTIKDRRYWGDRGLQIAFSFFVIKEYFKNIRTPFYWFLISKGYKTYLLMAKNFIDYAPRFDQTTSSFQKELIDNLAVQRFPSSYDPNSGTLKFSEALGRLKEESVPVTSKDLRNPYINFFVSKNPGYSKGEELCCVASINLTTFAFYAVKVLTDFLFPPARVHVRVKKD